MSQRFVKGLTNNHLTWVMVDATDFATPESALSAATAIKIYGKLRGAAGVNFVSSGTGSLTNDITHVGASVTGIYSIGLAKADLSDASAAWYDQYIITLSATGAARQTLVVDGGIVESVLLALSDAISNVQSTVDSQFVVISNYLSNASNYLSNISAIASDAHSAAILGASHASDAASYALLVQSRLSDFMSAIYPSDISDIRSMLTALSDAISNVDSAVNSQYSDLASKIGAVTATVSASDISDIASAVWAAKYTANSAASSFGSLFSDVFSRVALIQSTASDAYSAILLVQSRLSDFNSAYVSDISDIVSALTVIDSRVLLTQSAASNAYSAAVAISDQVSNVLSALVVIDDFLDAEIAQINSRVALIQSDASNTYSLLNTAHAEPTGVPAANATLVNKIGFMFAALRNKITVTSTKMQFFDDADAAMWEKDLTDDGTVYTETEANLP